MARPATAEWRRVDSPNFVVIGDVGASRLRDINLEFEGFRETLSRVLTERATATAVPTVLIVFPSDRAFTPFKPTFEGEPIELSGLFVGAGTSTTSRSSPTAVPAGCASFSTNTRTS